MQHRVGVIADTHAPYNQEHDGRLLFNPGSANDRRRQARCSIGKLFIDDEEMSVRGEIIALPV
jgi:predicted phosphodiesterase